MDNHVPQANPKKLFVGNLPWATTEEELRSLFGEHGEVVDCKLITDRATGRSKGIAFVEFAEESQAEAAIEALSGYNMNGRDIVVNVARPQAPRENRGGFGGDRSGYRGGGDRRGGYGGGRGNDRGGYRN
jgi:RNA recognition motif-containing protein